MRELAEAVWEALPPDAVPEHLELRRSFLLEHVRAGQDVLDIGCGAGELSEALAQAGARPVGVDIADGALRRARERMPAAELRLWADGEPLPAPDSSFDVVWAGEVIEHVPDVAPWLSELRRVLRPGGELLLTTPHHGRGRLLGLALSRRRFAEHFDPRSDHVRFFAPGTLRTLLEDLGFEVLALRPAGGPRGARHTLLARARRA